MRDFGGFEALNGVFTDNTGSVKNKREGMARRYVHVVQIQDQAHVGNILMSDFGELSRISKILETLAEIGCILRRYRKLRAKI